MVSSNFDMSRELCVWLGGGRCLNFSFLDYWCRWCLLLLQICILDGHCLFKLTWNTNWKLQNVVLFYIACSLKVRSLLFELLCTRAWSACCFCYTHKNCMHCEKSRTRPWLISSYISLSAVQVSNLESYDILHEL